MSEIMNVVYRSFYEVNETTINAGMDDKTLRTVRKFLNELVEAIRKNAPADAATSNKGEDMYINRIVTQEGESIYGRNH